MSEVSQKAQKAVEWFDLRLDQIMKWTKTNEL